MKILLVDGAPAYGGQARHVCDLATGLQERGHEVTVACRHEKLASVLRPAEIPVMVENFAPGIDFGTVYNLTRAIRRAKFDIVHTHGVRAGATGRISAHIAGCPKVIHTVHTMSEDLMNNRGFAGRCMRMPYRCADRWLAKWTDIIITVSNDLRRRTIQQGIPKDKITTIHSGVNLSAYSVLVDKWQSRRKLTIPSGCKVVGTTARFTKQKNLGDLLRAAKQVAKKIDNVVFVLVGDGEEMPALKRLAQDLGISHKVLFPGYRSDIPNILPAFDVFAISSLWEGHPLAVLEAMAAELPVVAPSVTGIGETIVDGKTGYIVPPADLDSLADAIYSALTDGNARAMGEAGRELAIASFGLERMIEQIERVYFNAAERSDLRMTAHVLR